MDSKPDVKHLGVVDLVVMFITIGLAVVVGVYYAIVDRKKSVDNYYYGGRNMSPIAVGMSIAVTYISAITVIGFPAETYLFGTVMFWFSVSAIIPKSIACIYYIPLIHRLRLSTINEYLELRFNRHLRQISSLISLVGLMFYLGTTVYVPALALNAVTPLSLFTTIALTSLVCTTYTTIGGMKAVIWTDALQTVLMTVGGLAAMIRTISNVGGFSRVLEVSSEGGRLNFWNFDPNPTLRYTVWSYLFGKAVQGCLTTCVNQSISQRYLSCGTVNRARLALLFSLVPTVVLMGIAVLTGLGMYVYYEGCDPLELGTIKKSDQLLPYLVVDVFQDLPGMAGLFVAAAFSGTLSSVSSGLNSLAVLIMNDFVVLKKPNLSQTLRLTISKVIVLGIGVFVMCFAFIISNFDATILRVIFSINGGLSGPVLGVYTLGAFFPSSNSKGAAVGQITATIFTSWISFGSLIQGKSSKGNLPLPTSTESCPIESISLENSTSDSLSASYSNYDFGFLTTDSASTVSTNGNGLESTLYAISFMYYGTISLVITVLVGYIVSQCTGPNDPEKSDPKLFLQILDNPIFPENVRKFFRFGVPELSKAVDVEEKEKFNSSSDSSEKLDKFNSSSDPPEKLDKFNSSSDPSEKLEKLNSNSNSSENLKNLFSDNESVI